MIRALIFDFDGLILETELPEYLSWQEIYQEHQSSLPLSEWAACVGTSADRFDPCAYLEAQIGRPVNRAELGSRQRQRSNELIDAQAAQPGVEAFLTDATRLGLKIGLASSSSSDWVTGHLARLGLLEYFDCIKCADHVQQVKPDPQLYLAVLAELDIEPHQAIAFEDSPNGVLAAKRAGLFCVAVPNAITRQLALDQADLQLASLAALPLKMLLEEVMCRLP
jgi:HAD superfamily hydrolase (TIGR01509 family)